MARVILRPLAPDDGPAFTQAARRSRALHRPWVAPPVTAEQFAAYLARFSPPAHYGYVVVLRDTGALVGAVNVTNIVYGALRSGYLGYFAFAGHQGRGLMKEGLQAACRHAFGALGLHRLEANIQPANSASIHLARACGFALEGYSPKYLKLGGRWRDHERWARLRTGEGR